eukprot:1181999-Prorocentrum_minimum.AAC.3
MSDVKETLALLFLLLVFALIASGYVLRVGLQEGKRSQYELVLRWVRGHPGEGSEESVKRGVGCGGTMEDGEGGSNGCRMASACNVRACSEVLAMCASALMVRGGGRSLGKRGWRGADSGASEGERSPPSWNAGGLVAHVWRSETE